MTSRRAVFLAIATSLPLMSFAQAPDTVWIPNDMNAGTVNNVIQGDTLANGNRVNPNRIYLLHRGGYYSLNGPLVTKIGTHLRLEGQPAPSSGMDSGMAVIVEGVRAGQEYPHIIDNYGDLSLKNIWLMYVLNTGQQTWTDLSMQSDSTKGYFENCIFDWDMGICVMAYGRHISLTFRNCIFRNCIDPSQWWAGRQLATASAGALLDSVVSTNCTFENMGFTFQADFTPPEYVYYDHNTFLNIAKFPFKIIWMTHLVATNSIFVNCHFTGERKVDRMGEDPDPELYGAVLSIDTIPQGVTYNGVPELDRVVDFTNNSNFMQPEFPAFYDSYNGLDTSRGPDFRILPEPMMNDRTLGMFTWHPKFTKAGIYDDVDPGFANPATNLDSIVAFLWDRYLNGGNCFWGFHPDLSAHWPLTEDLAYSNAKLLTAGTGGLPLGDLFHWFPEKYTQWLTLTSVKPALQTAPVSLRLEQNYPNPFNPKTVISGQWTADSEVRLVVYDLLGREIAVLANGRFPAGRYTFTFDGSNLSSGVYFYRLVAGNAAAVRKMTLVR